MKQTIRLLLMALPMILGLASCSNDDNPVVPDSEITQKIQGKWMVAETNGKPVVTNSKQVLTYVSDTKLYYSLSITAISDLNVWVNHCEGSYKVNGTTLEQLVELPDNNIKFSYHINVTSITDNEMQTVTNKEM